MASPNEMNVDFDFNQEIKSWESRNDISHTIISELKLILSSNTNIATVDRCRDTIKKQRAFIKENGLKWGSDNG